jgi:hypothetical protein
VSTLIRPRTPAASEPSPDEDPTGVRALLSALPEPEPMPEHVVDRINASLVAEQVERAARTSETSATKVTPLLSRGRGRRARVLFATAGAAAAVALVAVVGSAVSHLQQQVSATSAAVAPRTGAPPTSEQDRKPAEGGVGPTTRGGAPAAVAAPGTAETQGRLRSSRIRYTRTGFVAQARSLALASRLYGALEDSAGATTSPKSSSFPGAKTVTVPQACLRAIGADRAQVVWADVSTYEGKPALVIVASTNGKTLAYAVKPQCGPTGAFLLHPAVAIPLP